PPKAAESLQLSAALGFTARRRRPSSRGACTPPSSPAEPNAATSLSRYCTGLPPRCRLSYHSCQSLQLHYFGHTPVTLHGTCADLPRMRAPWWTQRACAPQARPRAPRHPHAPSGTTCPRSEERRGGKGGGWRRRPERAEVDRELRG